MAPGSSGAFLLAKKNFALFWRENKRVYISTIKQQQENMTTTKISKGYYKVSNEGQTFFIEDMEQRSCEEVSKRDKWYIYSGHDQDFVASVPTKTRALKLISRI